MPYLTFILSLACGVAPLMGHFQAIVDEENNLRLDQVLLVGENPNGSIVNAYGLAELPEGVILVADKLDYKIKKFDRRGNKISEIGKRGKGPGEFRGPGPLAVHRRTVAVADFASRKVQIFTADLQYQSTFYAPGPVIGLCFDPDGYLWVGVATGGRNESIFKYDVTGRAIRGISLKNSSGDIFEDVFSFTIAPSGEIIVAYMVLNKIEIWDTGGVFRTQFEVPAIPLRPPRKSLPRSGVLSRSVKVPEGNLFWNVATDVQGRIFILASEYTVNPNRDIYVFSTSGQFISHFALPEPACYVWIGSDGSLYTIEWGRRLIKKYRIGRL